MGNVPPSGFTLPTQLGRVTVSTRSEPIGSFTVQREVGLVFGNSRAYNNQEKSHGQQAHLTEAIQMMVAEAEKLGANAVLSVHVEFKDYGQNWAICQVYGTATCVAHAKNPFVSLVLRHSLFRQLSCSVEAFPNEKKRKEIFPRNWRRTNAIEALLSFPVFCNHRSDF